MREISSQLITETVARLCIEANKKLPSDIIECLDSAVSAENEVLPCSIMQDIRRNVDAAAQLDLPVCQDTGMAVVFIELGQDVHITGDLLEVAVNKGVRMGYEKGLLRKSVVGDPLERVNTNDNTPAVLHLNMVEGDKIKITVAPKGFGSENMSGIRMLAPAQGRDGVVDAVLDIVKSAGSNPCPPMVLGVGIGGDFEGCALLAKKALCRSTDKRNSNPYYAELEDELLKRVNELGIGPQGFGGKTTALAVNVEVAPTHIAGLPVAVNVGCHVNRHLSIEI
ncbi:MAG: fumarate hydratase [Clostridia bacterium]|nr:fumarate hydratase [Clostridia bacterium]